MKYHRDIYWPDMLARFYRRGTVKLRWTNHAMRELNDRYGRIERLDTLDTNAVEAIEVEFVDGKYHKTLYRIPGNGLDLCLAVMYNGVVKTAWLNETNDSHKTLRRNEYAQV